MDTLAQPTFLQRTLHFVRRKFLVILILVALVILALVFEAGRWSVYRTYPELSKSEQVQAILLKVGQLIQLPTDEMPTMATIDDAAAAKKAQPFLTNAERGDILLVYPNAAEALLYRPSTDKLIAVGPVNVGAGNQAELQNLPVATTTMATSTSHATGTKR